MSDRKTHSAKTAKKSPSKRARGRKDATKPRASGANDAQASERSLWKGSVSFGLVQIPVSLATAERANELSFHQLDKHDHSPIGYSRVNKRTGKKVEWDDIVKGYEVSKGHYVIVTDEDFENANVAATQTIDIQDFVDAAEIPPAYYEKPYHLLPDGKSTKAYAVLRDAMAKKNLVAIALVVIRSRQHLCAIFPRGEVLELELLRFEHELKTPVKRSVAGGHVTEKEVELAERLIDGMVAKWNPAKYKDTYRDDLLTAIHEKAKTGVVEPRNVPSAPHVATTTSDLLALLQKSVKAAGKPGTQKMKSHGKRATAHKAA